MNKIPIRLDAENRYMRSEAVYAFVSASLYLFFFSEHALSDIHFPSLRKTMHMISIYMFLCRINYHPAFVFLCCSRNDPYVHLLIYSKSSFLQFFDKLLFIIRSIVKHLLNIRTE